jgi:small subunit ribosomal protein S6
LRNYELLMIIDPEVAEEELPETLDVVANYVTSKGGVVTDTDRWGKRKLAYPIRHCKDGNYVLAHVQLEPGIIPELDSNLRISEKILRHMLIRVDEQ